MYNIKKDKRCINTVRRLKQGLLECLKTQKMENITVTDVASAAKVSRATFYRMFDSTSDLLAFMCDEFAGKMKTRLKDFDPSDREQHIRCIFSEWMDNADVIEGVYRSSRPDILQNALSRFRGTAGPISSDKTSDIDAEYIEAIHIASLSAILNVWVKNGKKEGPEYMLDLYKNVKSRL